MAGQPESAGTRARTSPLPEAATMPAVNTPKRLSPTIMPDASRMPSRLAISPYGFPDTHLL